jgi:hypothetical protein
MGVSRSLAILLVGLTSLATALPVNEAERGYCENTPTSRDCWGGFNIDSDATYTWPDTGVTRHVRQDCSHITGPDADDDSTTSMSDMRPSLLMASRSS